jgi:hypothetical protein
MSLPSAHQHSRESCAEKQNLLEQVRRAIDQLVCIHNEDLESVLRGEPTPRDVTEHRLDEARQLKGLLVERLKNHVGEHGC